MKANMLGQQAYARSEDVPLRGLMVKGQHAKRNAYEMNFQVAPVRRPRDWGAKAVKAEGLKSRLMRDNQVSTWVS